MKNYYLEEKIAISSDHAGFKLKERLKDFLLKKGFEVIDEGVFTNKKPSDYPDTAGKVAELVSKGKVSKGIVICGTGIGASIAANKFPNVRAALALTPRFAKLSRSHNDSNILALSGRFMTLNRAKSVLRTWLKTPFSNLERHKRRINKIKEIEKRIVSLLVLLILFFIQKPVFCDKIIRWEYSSLKELLLKDASFFDKDPPRISVSLQDLDSDAETECVLDFNEQKPVSDRTGNYPVKRFKVTRDTSFDFLDSPVAGFIRNDDRIVLSVLQNKLLSEQTDCGSFFISFWIYPVFTSAFSVICERVSVRKSKEYGIRVLLSNSKVVFKFENFFFDYKEKPATIIIQSEPLNRNWTHISCEFNRIDGKIRLLVNGEEEKVVWATTTGLPDGTVLTPHFTGTGDLIIGKDPFGYIENFQISKKNSDLFAGKKTVSDTAEIKTPVVETTMYGSKIFDISVNERQKINDLKIFVRSSDNPFTVEDIKPDWIEFGKSEISGKYHQVKLIITKNFKGVESLEVKIKEPISLEPPLNVQCKVTNNSLLVFWEPIADNRIKGYIVILRYKTSSGEMVLRKDAGNETFCFIDNLKSGITYTVTVSSYDSFIPPNQSIESRPFTITTLPSKELKNE